MENHTIFRKLRSRLSKFPSHYIKVVSLALPCLFFLFRWESNLPAKMKKMNSPVGQLRQRKGAKHEEGPKLDHPHEEGDGILSGAVAVRAVVPLAVDMADHVSPLSAKATPSSPSPLLTDARPSGAVVDACSNLSSPSHVSPLSDEHMRGRCDAWQTPERRSPNSIAHRHRALLTMVQFLRHCELRDVICPILVVENERVQAAAASALAALAEGCQWNSSVVAPSADLPKEKPSPPPAETEKSEVPLFRHMSDLGEGSATTLINGLRHFAISTTSSRDTALSPPSKTSTVVGDSPSSTESVIHINAMLMNSFISNSTHRGSASLTHCNSLTYPAIVNRFPIVYANQAALRLLEYESPSSVLEHPFEDLFSIFTYSANSLVNWPLQTPTPTAVTAALSGQFDGSSLPSPVASPVPQVKLLGVPPPPLESVSADDRPHPPLTSLAELLCSDAAVQRESFVFLYCERTGVYYAALLVPTDEIEIPTPGDTRHRRTRNGVGATVVANAAAEVPNPSSLGTVAPPVVEADTRHTDLCRYAMIYLLYRVSGPESHHDTAINLRSEEVVAPVDKIKDSSVSLFLREDSSLQREAMAASRSPHLGTSNIIIEEAPPTPNPNRNGAVGASQNQEVEMYNAPSSVVSRCSIHLEASQDQELQLRHDSSVQLERVEAAEPERSVASSVSIKDDPTAAKMPLAIEKDTSLSKYRSSATASDPISHLSALPQSPKCTLLRDWRLPVRHSQGSRPSSFTATEQMSTLEAQNDGLFEVGSGRLPSAPVHVLVHSLPTPSRKRRKNRKKCSMEALKRSLISPRPSSVPSRVCSTETAGQHVVYKPRLFGTIPLEEANSSMLMATASLTPTNSLGNSGTAAQGPLTPWRSLQKVRSVDGIATLAQQVRNFGQTPTSPARQAGPWSPAARRSRVSNTVAGGGGGGGATATATAATVVSPARSHIDAGLYPFSGNTAISWQRGNEVDEVSIAKLCHRIQSRRGIVAVLASVRLPQHIYINSVALMMFIQQVLWYQRSNGVNQIGCLLNVRDRMQLVVDFISVDGSMDKPVKQLAASPAKRRSLSVGSGERRYESPLSLPRGALQSSRSSIHDMLEKRLEELDRQYKEEELRLTFPSDVLFAVTPSIGGLEELRGAAGLRNPSNTTTTTTTTATSPMARSVHWKTPLPTSAAHSGSAVSDGEIGKPSSGGAEGTIPSIDTNLLAFADREAVEANPVEETEAHMTGMENSNSNLMSEGRERYRRLSQLEKRAIQMELISEATARVTESARSSISTIDERRCASGEHDEHPDDADFNQRGGNRARLGSLSCSTLNATSARRKSLPYVSQYRTGSNSDQNINENVVPPEKYLTADMQQYLTACDGETAVYEPHGDAQILMPFTTAQRLELLAKLDNVQLSKYRGLSVFGINLVNLVTEEAAHVASQPSPRIIPLQYDIAARSYNEDVRSRSVMLPPLASTLATAATTNVTTPMTQTGTVSCPNDDFGTYTVSLTPLTTPGSEALPSDADTAFSPVDATLTPPSSGLQVFGTVGSGEWESRPTSTSTEALSVSSVARLPSTAVGVSSSPASDMLLSSTAPSPPLSHSNSYAAARSVHADPVRYAKRGSVKLSMAAAEGTSPMASDTTHSQYHSRSNGDGASGVEKGMCLPVVLIESGDPTEQKLQQPMQRRKTAGAVLMRRSPPAPSASPSRGTPPVSTARSPSQRKSTSPAPLFPKGLPTQGSWLMESAGGPINDNGCGLHTATATQLSTSAYPSVLPLCSVMTVSDARPSTHSMSTPQLRTQPMPSDGTATSVFGSSPGVASVRTHKSGGTELFGYTLPSTATVPLGGFSTALTTPDTDAAMPLESQTAVSEKPDAAESVSISAAIEKPTAPQESSLPTSTDVVAEHSPGSLSGKAKAELVVEDWWRQRESAMDANDSFADSFMDVFGLGSQQSPPNNNIRQGMSSRNLSGMTPFEECLTVANEETLRRMRHALSTHSDEGPSISQMSLTSDELRQKMSSSSSAGEALAKTADNANQSPPLEEAILRDPSIEMHSIREKATAIMGRHNLHILVYTTAAHPEIEDVLGKYGHCTTFATHPAQLLRYVRAGLHFFDVLIVQWTDVLVTDEVRLVLSNCAIDETVVMYYISTKEGERAPMMDVERVMTDTTVVIHGEDLLTGLFSRSVLEEVQQLIRRRRLLRAMVETRLMQAYQIVRQIGSGAFGDVFEVMMYVSKGKLAMKRIFLKSMKLRQLEVINREVTIMSRLEHPNIVSFSHTCLEDNAYSIFMELCDSALADLLQDPVPEIPGVAKRQDAQRWIHLAPTPTPPNVSHQRSSRDSFSLGTSYPNSSGTSIRPQDAVMIVHDIASALAYLHQNGIIHRDVKPANVLFANGVAKLGDFGSAVKMNESRQLRNMKGTISYMAPEMILGEAYNESCDLWSFGCLIACVLGINLGHVSGLHMPALNDLYRTIPATASLPLTFTNRFSSPFETYYSETATAGILTSLKDALAREVKEQEAMPQHLRRDGPLHPRSQSCANPRKQRKNIWEQSSSASVPSHMTNHASDGGEEESIQIYEKSVGGPVTENTEQRRRTATCINVDNIHLLSSYAVSLPASLVELFEGLLHRDPNQRMTAAEVLEHPVSWDVEWMSTMMLEIQRVTAELSSTAAVKVAEGPSELTSSIISAAASQVVKRRSTMTGDGTSESEGGFGGRSSRLRHNGGSFFSSSLQSLTQLVDGGASGDYTGGAGLRKSVSTGNVRLAPLAMSRNSPASDYVLDISVNSEEGGQFT